MITYLIKSGLCLGILLAFYYLVLEREKMHRFNRFYLLGSVLFSFIAPSFVIYVEAKKALQEVAIYNTTIESANLSFFEQYFTVQNVLILIYVIVSTIFLFRFINNLNHIIRKIKANEVIKSTHAKFVPVSDEIQPHTFWNYIFINKEDYSNQKIEEELFTHELAHVTQRHTIDVLIIETLQILFWFNPLFFLLKKAVQLNHEFLADDKVISSHQNIPRYQTLLLSKASWQNEYYLASNLNYSLTKKRLLMMKTQNSKKSIILKKMAVLPLLAGLVFLFANRVEAQTKKKEKPVVVEIKKEATKAQIKEYKAILSEGKKTNRFKMEDVKRAKFLYSLMSEEQKKATGNIYKLIPPPPPPAKIYVKEVKNKKGNKPPKPVKIEVVEVPKKTVKKPKPPKKVQIIEEIEEIREEVEKEEIIEEAIEVKEIQEVEEIREVEEVREVIPTTENVELKELVEVVREREPKHDIIVVENLKNHTGKKHYDSHKYMDKNHLPDYDKLAKDGFIFYIDGKKSSARKAKKLAKDNIMKIDVLREKENNGGKIYIYTK